MTFKLRAVITLILLSLIALPSWAEAASKPKKNSALTVLDTLSVKGRAPKPVTPERNLDRRGKTLITMVVILETIFCGGT